MHVNAKKMAFGGLLLALIIVCMVLGSVIESNTLFLLAAASYFVGIFIREAGMRTGGAFYLAAVLLGFMVAPNKLYVVSFAAMGFYILAVEVSYCYIGKIKRNVNRKLLFWAVKYVIFNLMYIPILFFFQKLLFGRSLSAVWLAGIIAAGQAGLWIYDRAYEYVQGHIWNKMRGRLF
ncbi:hypothetical protein DWX43_05270 [Clostridium sp. AF19-22AC]|jgi:hypothetical protein|uniref:hypothetical protein n=1 Tax=Clostridia TaxID=186801 RepID=UPI000E4E2510|nr:MULTISPECIES: hypothetical protein [Clostridia]RHR32059.1 hypothetical protein DWX43_05270 [Clostridium sp. AF19-22AC]